MTGWEFPSGAIELDDLMKNFSDIAGNTSHIEMDLGRSKYIASNNTLVTDKDDAVALTTASFNQLCDMLDVPTKYGERMPDKLADYTINYLLSEGARRPYNALVDNDMVVRSFMRPDMPYVRHDDLLTSIVDSFDGAAPFVHRWQLNGGKFNIQLRSEELTFEDPGGSVLFGGVEVSYDDSWKRHPMFKTFLNRLVCDNGASVNVESRKFRVDGYSAEGVLSQAREFSSLALVQVQQMVEGLLAMQNDKIKNAEAAIRNLCIQHKLPNKLRELLIRYLTDDRYLATVPDGRVGTMYDVVNLFTFVGTHDYSITQEYRDLLCEIGGGAMFTHDDTCVECGSTL
jgi:hypothetical protein